LWSNEVPELNCQDAKQSKKLNEWATDQKGKYIRITSLKASRMEDTSKRVFVFNFFARKRWWIILAQNIRALKKGM
jgi:hypothetical protein